MLVDILKPKDPKLLKRDANNLSLGCFQVLVLGSCLIILRVLKYLLYPHKNEAPRSMMFPFKLGESLQRVAKRAIPALVPKLELKSIKQSLTTNVWGSRGLSPEQQPRISAASF